MKTQLQQKDILFPVPSALVVSGVGNDTNIATVAWVGMVSCIPPTLGISLHKNRHSLSLIRKTQEFTVNIPRQNDFEKTDYCGMVSGRNTNKFKDVGFSKIDGHRIKTPLIKECPFNLECKVIQEVEIGDWIFIIGEILEANIDSDCIDENGKVKIDEVDPLVYIPTIREYWSIGEKLGDSFKVGLKYKLQIIEHK